jgi:hypothetical protein
VLISGYSEDITDPNTGMASHYSYYLSKYSAQGSLVWSKVIGNYQMPYTNTVAHLDVDITGNCYLTGVLAKTSQDWNIGIWKFDSNGNQKLNVDYGFSNYDFPYGIVADQHGNIFVTAASIQLSPLAWNYRTLKFDGSGVLQWNLDYDSNDNTPAIMFKGGQNIFVAGGFYKTGIVKSGLLLKYSDPISFQLYSTDTYGYKNTEVLVPVKANDFNNLISGQFSLNWNPSVAEFVSVEQYGLTGMDANSFGSVNASNGKLNFSWIAPNNLQPQSLADSSTLFAIRFKLVGNYGDTTQVGINDVPVPVEFADANYALVPSTTYAGTLHINSTINLSGKVLYSNNDPVQSVSVNVSGAVSPLITNAQGNYSVDVVPNQSYILTPSKINDPEPVNGIDIQDVASMRRHILQTELLGSPYQIIAADVNQSHTVTTFDIVLVQALILGIKNNFPNNAQWTFVPADFQFANAKNPFPYPTSKTLSGTVSATSDFIAMKYGDVDDSRDNSQSGRTQVADVIFETGQPQEENDIVTVPIKVYGFKDISAYQFTVKWDTEDLEFIGKSNGSVNGEFGEHGTANGALTTLWDDGQGKSKNLPDGSTLFILKFLKKSTASNVRIELNSFTPARVFDGALKRLNFMTQQEAEISDEFEIAIYPNPFNLSSPTNIRLTLPQAGLVALEIMAIDGRKIRTVVTECNAGANTAAWDGKDDAGNEVTSGVYMVKLMNGNINKVMKVVKN